jgi:phosphate starvation-inducible PhoH-like protein
MPLTSVSEDNIPPKFQRDTSPLEALTPRQQDYINAIRSNPLTFGIGPAGTGKTWIAASIASQLLEDREVDRIIVTRPAVEAGEELGHLPGELSEKWAPYFAPVRHVLERRLGKGAVEMYLKSERIVIMPLAYMRGHTFQNSFVLLDEAQNTTPSQMKLFLTRIGEGSRIAVDGDLSQRDIRGPSGLTDALGRVRHLPGVGVVKFDRSDVVRSGLVQQIVEAYQDESDLDEAEEGLLRTLSAGK